MKKIYVVHDINIFTMWFSSSVLKYAFSHFFLIGVYLLYNVAFISALQQCESATCVHNLLFHGLPSHLDHHKVLSRVSCAMTNLDNILKSRDITLPAKVCLVKAMVFPVVRYGCEGWTIKKAKHWRMDAFELCVGEDSWESLGLQGDPTSPS